MSLANTKKFPPRTHCTHTLTMIIKDFLSSSCMIVLFSLPLLISYSISRKRTLEWMLISHPRHNLHAGSGLHVQPNIPLNIKRHARKWGTALRYVHEGYKSGLLM